MRRAGPRGSSASARTDSSSHGARGRRRGGHHRSLTERARDDDDTRAHGDGDGPADQRGLGAACRGADAGTREKQQQLVQTAKLASLGELSAGIAHELNNPLNNINLFVHNALDQVDKTLHGQPAQESIHRGLDMALGQIARAARIINNLRSFARTAGTDRGPVPVTELIHDSVSLLHEKLHQGNIEVAVTLEDPRTEVWANRLQLEQVLVNLLTNACDALHVAAVKQITVTGRTDQAWHVITVSDTGEGMPAEMVPRIFDPFFTTKEVGVGTGLGLSIVYGIIKEHGGHISVHSQVGEGTTFEIRLPRPAVTHESVLPS